MGKGSLLLFVAREIEKSAKKSAKARYRQEREEMKHVLAFQREMAKANRATAAAMSKLEAAKHAQNEVAKFEFYLAMLTSMHKTIGDPVDWTAILESPAPAAPQRQSNREQLAQLDLDSYKPGFFEKLFGRDKRNKQEFQMQVTMARQEDDLQYQREYAEYKENYDAWVMELNTAKRILARDPDAYMPGMKHFEAFAEIEAYGSKVITGAATEDAILMQVVIGDVVPDEIVKLTPGGKVTTSSMPAGRYWELFQDHVCSCALRLAQETFSILPVDRAIVNIGRIQLSPTTGRDDFATFLAVHFLRQQLEPLDLQNIDPSSMMVNFSHRMKFAKTKGFTPVEAIALDEQFVTT